MEVVHFAGEALDFLRHGAEHTADLFEQAIGAVGPPSQPLDGSLYIVNESHVPNWREDEHTYVSFGEIPPSSALPTGGDESCRRTRVLPVPAHSSMLKTHIRDIPLPSSCAPGQAGEILLEQSIVALPPGLQRRALRLCSPGLTRRVWLVQYLSDAAPEATYDTQGHAQRSSAGEAAVLPSSASAASPVEQPHMSEQLGVASSDAKRAAPHYTASPQEPVAQQEASPAAGVENTIPYRPPPSRPVSAAGGASVGSASSPPPPSQGTAELEEEFELQHSTATAAVVSPKLDAFVSPSGSEDSYRPGGLQLRHEWLPQTDASSPESRLSPSQRYPSDQEAPPTPPPPESLSGDNGDNFFDDYSDGYVSHDGASEHGSDGYVSHDGASEHGSDGYVSHDGASERGPLIAGGPALTHSAEHTAQRLKAPNSARRGIASSPSDQRAHAAQARAAETPPRALNNQQAVMLSPASVSSFTPAAPTVHYHVAAPTHAPPAPGPDAAQLRSMVHEAVASAMGSITHAQAPVIAPAQWLSMPVSAAPAAPVGHAPPPRPRRASSASSKDSRYSDSSRRHRHRHKHRRSRHSHEEDTGERRSAHHHKRRHRSKRKKQSDKSRHHRRHLSERSEAVNGASPLPALVRHGSEQLVPHPQVQAAAAQPPPSPQSPGSASSFNQHQQNTAGQRTYVLGSEYGVDSSVDFKKKGFVPPPEPPTAGSGVQVPLYDAQSAQYVDSQQALFNRSRSPTNAVAGGPSGYGGMSGGAPSGYGGMAGGGPSGYDAMAGSTIAPSHSQPADSADEMMAYMSALHKSAPAAASSQPPSEAQGAGAAGAQAFAAHPAWQAMFSAVRPALAKLPPVVRGWQTRCLLRSPALAQLVRQIRDSREMLRSEQAAADTATGAGEGVDAAAEAFIKQLQTQIDADSASLATQVGCDSLLALRATWLEAMKAGTAGRAAATASKRPAAVGASRRKLGAASKKQGGALGKKAMDYGAKIRAMNARKAKGTDAADVPAEDAEVAGGAGSPAAPAQEKPWKKRATGARANRGAKKNADELVTAARTVQEGGRWRLAVCVVEARGLQPGSANPKVLAPGPGMAADASTAGAAAAPKAAGARDPYAEVYIVQRRLADAAGNTSGEPADVYALGRAAADGTHASVLGPKRQTGIVQGSLEPAWNKTMLLTVPLRASDASEDAVRVEGGLPTAAAELTALLQKHWAESGQDAGVELVASSARKLACTEGLTDCASLWPRMQWPAVDLRVEVRDGDRFAKETFMGWCSVPLHEVARAAVLHAPSAAADAPPLDTWVSLRPREEHPDAVRGQVRLKVILIPPSPARHTEARLQGLHKASLAASFSTAAAPKVKQVKSSGYGQSALPKAQGAKKQKATSHKVDWSHVKPRTHSQAPPAHSQARRSSAGVGTGYAAAAAPQGGGSGIPQPAGRRQRPRSMGREAFVVGRVYEQPADQPPPQAEAVRRDSGAGRRKPPKVPGAGGAHIKARKAADANTQPEYEDRRWEQQLRGAEPGGHRRRSGSGAWGGVDRAAPDVDEAGAVEYAPREFDYDDPALWISAQDVHLASQQGSASFPPPPPGMLASGQVGLGGAIPPPPPPPPPPQGHTDAHDLSASLRANETADIADGELRSALREVPAQQTDPLASDWYNDEAARFVQDLQARMHAAGMGGYLTAASPDGKPPVPLAQAAQPPAAEHEFLSP